MGITRTPRAIIVKPLTSGSGVGVVTLIGDGMKYSSGVASIAIGAIPNIH